MSTIIFYSRNRRDGGIRTGLGLGLNGETLFNALQEGRLEHQEDPLGSALVWCIDVFIRGDHLKADREQLCRRLIRQVEVIRDGFRRFADAILTPVVIEFLCGTMSPQDLELHRVFLDEFEIIDQGQILKADWEKAKRYAVRVRGDSKPRDFTDCLIAAIASRLGCETLPSDIDHQCRSNSSI